MVHTIQLNWKLQAVDACPVQRYGKQQPKYHHAKYCAKKSFVGSANTQLGEFGMGW